MVDPKVFFRELDALLAKIRREKPDQVFLFSILDELQSLFGEQLRINRGRIYQRRGESFHLVHPKSMKSAPVPGRHPCVQLVAEHGSYIFDSAGEDNPFALERTGAYAVPAAIRVHSPDQQWIFVYDLGSGWIREEVTLFLNAVRTALNYRLYSDLIGGPLEQAVQIQRSLLPRSAPHVDGYQVYGRSDPAELVGGDFYEYLQREKNSLAVCIGDVSGHGLPAALLVRDVVVGLRMGMAKELRMRYTLEKLNQVIHRSTFSTNFVSLFVCELDNDGHLFYVNAGHPKPLLVNGDNVRQLETTGLVLGFLPQIELQRSHVQMEPGSALLLYSDGIVERLNRKGEQYGVDRVIDLLRQHQGESARSINQTLFKQVWAYGGHGHWQDDATAVVIKRI